jgi:hypothetical protein
MSFFIFAEYEPDNSSSVLCDNQSYIGYKKDYYKTDEKPYASDQFIFN